MTDLRKNYRHIFDVDILGLCKGCDMTYGTGPHFTPEELGMAEIPKSVTVRINAEVNVIRPGDTIIIGTGDDVSMHAAEDMGNAIKKGLPGVSVIIVPACVIAVYRPDRIEVASEPVHPEGGF